MEGLRKRLVVFAVIVFAFAGLIRIAIPRTKYDPKTETWLESQAPVAFNGYTFAPSGTNAQQSYKMSESTYETLNPYGIVARVFSNGKHTFDTVLIAGSSGKSFHNPKVCFTSQGYTITDTRTEMVQSKKHGQVPVTVAVMKSEKGNDGNGVAVYFYHTPLGFRALTTEIRKDLIIAKALRKPNLDGVFYRVIGLSKDTTEAETLKFVGEFLDAANESSKGYF
ncbi:exosortase-associated EpsI family protein [bacterium]|nr:MAG: exosortase-associated EpsI family protein [bacterium]